MELNDDDLLLLFVMMEVLLVEGDDEMTPGRGRWSEHTTIAFSTLCSLLSLFPLMSTMLLSLSLS